MKNKKILLLILFLSTLFSVKITSVYAKDCTDIRYSPPMPQVYGYWQTKPTDRLKTSAPTCTGPNAQVWFGKLNYWSEWTILIFADLYEDDEEPNPDDLVKGYTLYFVETGYLDRVEVVTHDYGNIESEGDQGCELFLRFHSGGRQGRTTPANLFTYKICMV